MAGSAASWDDRLQRGDRNSFDAVRLVLATLVVLEHSYFLIHNSYGDDPLSVISRGQTNSGQFAVYMFFALSGFLVTHSFVTSTGLGNYLAKRVARIVPGFLVASASGVLIVGPLTSDDLASYFASQNWRNIILTVAALKQVNVVNALASNPIPMVHGTLWTIQYEFDCYLLLGLFGVLGLLRPPFKGPFFIVLAFVFCALMFVPLPAVNTGILGLLVSSPDRWFDLFPFFFLGSAFYLFRGHIPKSPLIFIASLLVIAITFAFGGAHWALLFCGAYAVLFVSLSVAGEVKIAGRRVDLSYGVYLYGWPIAQVLLYFLGDRIGPLPLFLLSMAVCLPTAWLSWVFIEKPALAAVRHHSLKALERTAGSRTLA